MYYSFVKYFCIVLLVFLSGFVLFSFFINPFGIYSGPLIKYVNHQKIDDHERMPVAVNLIKYKPKVIALGTSRVLSGFDNETLREWSKGESFYNASFAGASFDEIYAYFLHALHLQSGLKTVFLGIDLLSFNTHRKPQKNFSETRLNRNHWTLSDIKDSLFSRKSFLESCKSFYASLIDKSPPNPILAWGELKYLQSMLETDENYANYSLDQKKIQKFAHMMSICKERSIEIKVFICPVKAMYWDFYFQNGLWHHVEELKRQLCAIHPLWDFSGFNSITTERLESEGNPLYHECSHCTAYTGSLLLKRMYNKTSSIDSVGFLLTPENIEDALLQIREDHQKWLTRNQ